LILPQQAQGIFQRCGSQWAESPTFYVLWKSLNDFNKLPYVDSVYILAGSGSTKPVSTKASFENVACPKVLATSP
jgi:hypothetical protein